MKRTRGDVIFDTVNYVLVSRVLPADPLPAVLHRDRVDQQPGLRQHRGDHLLSPRDHPRGLRPDLPGSRTCGAATGTRSSTRRWAPCINVSLTMTAGYALSRKELCGRSVIMRLIVFTMLFSGGLIPTYLIVKGLGMTNTIWAMVIPNAVSAWNLIIARTYLQTEHPPGAAGGLPRGRLLLRPVLLGGGRPAVGRHHRGARPACTPSAHWNSFFHGPDLPAGLRQVPAAADPAGHPPRATRPAVSADDAKTLQEMQRIADLMKYALIIVASLPGDGPLPVPAALLREGRHGRRHQGVAGRRETRRLDTLFAPRRIPSTLISAALLSRELDMQVNACIYSVTWTSTRCSRHSPIRHEGACWTLCEPKTGRRWERCARTSQ